MLDMNTIILVIKNERRGINIFKKILIGLINYSKNK